MKAPTHMDIQRDMGRMEGKQDAMGERLDRLEQIVEDGFKAIRRDIAELKQAEDKRKGAWTLGHYLYGAATGVIAFIAAHFLK